MVRPFINPKRILTSITIAIFLSIAIQSHCEAAAASVSLVYFDPPRIVGTADETFNVTLYCKDVINLYTWQAGFHFDPNILNCTAVYGGPSLTDDVFDVLAPSAFTSWIPGTINNTLGKVYYSAQSLSGADGVTGTAGVAYKLMKVGFKVKTTGVADIHLSDVLLLPPSYGMPNNIIDVYTAYDTDQVVTILTNSTGETKTDIKAHYFNTSNNELGWNLTTIIRRDWATTTIGFCNVTIPKTLLWVDTLTDWQVLINGAAPLSFPTPTQDSNNYYLYFTYNHLGTLSKPGSIKIQIIGQHVIPEFSSNLVLVLLMMFTLIAAALGKTFRSRKLHMPL